MRGIGHDRRLPATVAARSKPDPKIIQCLTCDKGYRVVERTLSVLSGKPCWRKRRDAEAAHGHPFISSYLATKRLTWEEHCDHCHGAGEAL